MLQGHENLKGQERRWDSCLTLLSSTSCTHEETVSGPHSVWESVSISHRLSTSSVTDILLPIPEKATKSSLCLFASTQITVGFNSYFGQVDWKQFAHQSLKYHVCVDIFNKDFGNDPSLLQKITVCFISFMHDANVMWKVETEGKSNGVHPYPSH